MTQTETTIRHIPKLEQTVNIYKRDDDNPLPRFSLSPYEHGDESVEYVLPVGIHVDTTAPSGKPFFKSDDGFVSLISSEDCKPVVMIGDKDGGHLALTLTRKFPDNK